MPEYPLSSIQGNILKSFSRDYACYLFLRFKASAHEKRSELSEALQPLVTSAWRQAEITEQWKRGGESAPVGMFGLAFCGFQHLGLTRYAPASSELGADFYRDPAKLSYYPGFRKDHMQPPFDHEVDAFLLLADNDAGRLETLVSGATEALSTVAEVVGLEQVYRKTAEGREVDHFGFRDQISRGPDPDSVLFPDECSPPGMASFGVLLKIEQDVGALERQAAELASLYQKLHATRPATGKDKVTFISAEDTKALAVGRYSDGRPLADVHGGLDDFDYHDDPHGERCPLQAHSRAMNPRDGSPVRILRRGMSFGSEGSPRGLLFLGMQRSLNDYVAVIRRAAHLRDPILADSNDWDIGVNPDDATHCNHHMRAQRWNAFGKEVCFRFSNLTKLLSGGFFYIPSMNLINTLGSIPTDAPPVKTH